MLVLYHDPVMVTALHVGACALAAMFVAGAAIAVVMAIRVLSSMVL